MCWSAYLLKRHPKLGKLGMGGAGVNANAANDLTSSSDYETKVPLDQRVYSQYFVQDSDPSAGILMDTKIPLKEVNILHLKESQECS